MRTIYDYTVKMSDGKEKSLRDYVGKTLLIVNTASKCGFTPQFEGLQTLYEKYKDRGFVILGFPCDQFKQQEFDNIEETIQFCQINYGVSFPMFAKIDVNGENEHPLYTYLKEQQKGVFSNAIKWNFTKFLVDKNGLVVERYSPTTKPDQMEEDIVKYLGDF
ncbi:glutathione peroxidase [Lederbergia panacisoli]|uniref:glutathione peroxidase n=1 Tax=Lederbergia panacisoli TaxID=1255251 RepID=UPI00214AC696|nr:glutathione peroxidase [Lederbergia panacisoli]MCR2823560.1 glutathione peroxidase [Lederbergia panacisoli]